MGPRRATGTWFMAEIMDLGGICTQEISCVHTRDLLCAHRRSPVYTQQISYVHTMDLVRTHKRSLVYTQEISCVHIPPRSIISATNQVPVARLGPILSQDGATLTRKPSKPLPPLFPPAWGSKIPQNIEIEELGVKLINLIN